MDANERLHIEWIGMAQPEGLVVTTAALKAAEANITWPVAELQARVRELAAPGNAILDLRGYCRDILEWSDDFVVDAASLPASLRVTLDGGEILAPTLAVRDADEPGKFVLLVQETHRAKLDVASDDKRWSATEHQRFYHLLRETGVPVGLLTNGQLFRLVYAPKGESAGWITFRLSDMLTVDGRPLLGALHMLLNERRLISLEASKRLGGLLLASREYQNTVSSALREQILSALRELLLGFQRADRLAGESILGAYRRGHLQEVYSGLVTVMMRMVFILYAEEKNLLPMEAKLYADGYSLTRLYAQLREDRGRHGDTMDERYGAWARVITLFRLLHDGARAATGLVIAARKGDFFRPDAYPFLEGRERGSVRQGGEILDLPKVSDGVVFRVLDLLLMLKGERLQYRGLDVEQIGSVYEGLMGFEIETAEGDSLCLMPEHVVVNLEALLGMAGGERGKELKRIANLDLKDKAGGELKSAKTVPELQAALGRRLSARQPGLIAKSEMFLQPGEERRKTGSHYTPRALTQPIVETTLRPVLERLGPEVMPEQILALKICDPAMGSGAFLVEACRQLADHLVAAWRRTRTMPELPPDEDPLLHARRLIAQRCIYGVDKNPLAADLARLSMWLVTFAREHPFTFVDHALRCGDSLVGLSREQISNLSLDVKGGFKQIAMVRGIVAPAVAKAKDLRDQIHAIGDPLDDGQLVQLWDEANEALGAVRFLGDLVISAYFSADSDKARKKEIEDLGIKVPAWLATGQYDSELKGFIADLREGDKGVVPFHWEIEFPEVFARDNSGFDCFVGNPPFLGGSRISEEFGSSYADYISATSEDSRGKGDLVGFFFRRAFSLQALGGCLGLVATNSIRQGDTRLMSLGWIRSHGGRIFAATKRLRWPGAAAVVVSVVHIQRPPFPELCVSQLDGLPLVNRTSITAYLLAIGPDGNPNKLASNRAIAFSGTNPNGRGFVILLADVERFRALDRRNADHIKPYLGGEELNESPAASSVRFIIDFEECDEAHVKSYPRLYQHLFNSVRVQRQSSSERRLRDFWWHFSRPARDLKAAARLASPLLASSRHSKHLTFSAQSHEQVFSDALTLFVLPSWSGFCFLQSRIHECWAHMFGSTIKDDLRYIPEDCFETFPFSVGWSVDERLAILGRSYHDFRAALMLETGLGLTETYNRFHDPGEHSHEILKLRDLHAQMDRAVIDAYGWTDILPAYDFRQQLDESTRLTWAEETRDEVVARLLELNRVLAAGEAEEASAAKGAKPARKVAEKKKGKKDEATLALPLGQGDPESA